MLRGESVGPSIAYLDFHRQSPNHRGLASCGLCLRYCGHTGDSNLIGLWDEGVCYKAVRYMRKLIVQWRGRVQMSYLNRNPRINYRSGWFLGLECNPGIFSSLEAGCIGVKPFSPILPNLLKLLVPLIDFSARSSSSRHIIELQKAVLSHLISSEDYVWYDIPEKTPHFPVCVKIEWRVLSELFSE